MAFLVFQDGKLKREYSAEDFHKVMLAKAKFHSEPGEWVYWVETESWFVARPDQQGYTYIDAIDRVPKEYQAIVLLYL